MPQGCGTNAAKRVRPQLREMKGPDLHKVVPSETSWHGSLSASGSIAKLAASPTCRVCRRGKRRGGFCRAKQGATPFCSMREPCGMGKKRSWRRWREAHGFHAHVRMYIYIRGDTYIYIIYKSTKGNIYVPNPEMDSCRIWVTALGPFRGKGGHGTALGWFPANGGHGTNGSSLLGNPIAERGVCVCVWCWTGSWGRVDEMVVVGGLNAQMRLREGGRSITWWAECIPPLSETYYIVI